MSCDNFWRYYIFNLTFSYEVYFLLSMRVEILIRIRGNVPSKSK